MVDFSTLTLRCVMAGGCPLTEQGLAFLVLTALGSGRAKVPRDDGPAGITTEDGCRAEIALALRVLRGEKLAQL